NNETYVFDERGIVLSKTVGDRTTYTTEGIRALGDPNDLNDTYDKIATNIENEITNGSADYFVEFNENKEPKEATIYKNGKLYKRIGYDENGNATLLEDKYGLTLEGVGIINNPNVTDDKYDAICNTFGLDPNTQGGQIRLVKPNTEDNNAYNNVWQIGALDGNGEIATRYQLPSNTSTEFNPDNISDDIKPENLLEDEHGLTALGLKVDLGQSKIYDIITYGTDEQKAVLAKKLGINVDDLDNLRIEPLKNNKNDEASKDAKDVQETKNEKEIISYIVVGSNVEFSFPTEKGFETNTIQIGDVVYDLGDIYENTDNKTFEFRKLRDDNGYTAAGAVKKDPKMAQILDKTNENVKFSLTSNQEDGTIISWKVNEGEIKINGKDYTYTLPEGATLSQNSDNDSSTHLDEYEIEVTGVIDDQGNDATIVLGFGAGDDTLYYIENINLEHIDLIYPDNQSSDLSRERHWNCSAGSYDLDNLFANKEIPWNVKMKLVDYNDMENLLGINYVNSIGSGQSCPQSWYTDQLNIMISNDPISVEEIIQFTKTYSNMAGTNSTIIYALTYSQENCINLINALSNNATAEELKEFNKIVPFEKLFTYYNRDNLAGIEISEAFIKLFSRNDFYEKNSTNEAGIWNIAKTTCECGDINNRPKLQYVLEAYEKGLYKGKYTDEEIRQYIINLYSRENPSNDKIYDPENLIDDLDKMYTVVWPFNIPKNYHQTFLKIMNPFN
ncbi:MAG: hypothetical protein IJ003_01810, partial [Candidatus Gastranaerophilales bacterium]|nr:hypothetical protein [Candidatus Gastranaerophilales bacterium]